MPIKRIQLRGISRTPSDRLTEDGGCAESLNVHLDATEIAPTLAPKDITEAIGYWHEAGYNIAYLHKTAAYDHNIVVYGDTPWQYIAYASEEMLHAILTLQNEVVQNITSIGNTLIISTDLHTHYALWKAETQQYHDLGTTIPEPKLEFIDENDLSGSRSEPGEIVISRQAYHADKWDAVHTFNTNVWTGILNGTYDTSDDNYALYQGEIEEIISSIWESFESMIYANRNIGYFCTPVMMRWALRMYDGSYVYQSAPILLGGYGPSHLRDGVQRMTTLPQGESVGGKTGCNISAQLSADAVHKVKVKLKETYVAGNWSDLIQSIDLFMSPEIYLPKLRTKFTNFTGGTSGQGRDLRYWGQMEIDNTDASAEDEITKIGNFYKIATFSIDNLTELNNGYAVKPLSGDYLLTQPTLDDDQSSHHEFVTINEPVTYNRRLLYPGAQVRLYAGYPFFQSVMQTVGHAPLYNSNTYYMLFYIKDPDGVSYVVKRQMIYPTKTGAYTPGVFSWITYPDTKCYKAQLVMHESTSDEWRVFDFTMKEHPRLNCSYCFGGFGKAITDYPYQVAATDPTANINNGDARYFDAKEIMMSGIDNPFLFPIANRIMMSGEIIGLATTTKALSTGQFGEFPMYAFTSDGIWALPINAEGVFMASRPLARDVAIAGTISPIDQAIVFVTERGVMMLNGSDITNLSPFMNGKHYVAELEVEELLRQDQCPWKDFVDILVDDTPFMAFMKDAKIIYDYAGNRLVCFNHNLLDYQYVYMIATQTWHKISAATSFRSIKILNSYPNTLVSCINGDGESVVLDYSTFLDESVEATNIKGIAISRPFDLDEPDVRKTIKSIRIRGQYNKADVKYLLLGSMDGLTFQLLHSLRGTSYKLYRIVLLTELTPHERISWIDVEYETRFTNKLR